MKTKPRLLTLKVSEDEYNRLRECAKRLTAGNVSKLLRDAALGELKKDEELEELRVRDRIAYGPRPGPSLVIEEIYGPVSDYSVGGSGGSGTDEKKRGSVS